MRLAVGPRASATGRTDWWGHVAKLAAIRAEWLPAAGAVRSLSDFGYYRRASFLTMGLIVGSIMCQCACAGDTDSPSHARPFFMPEWKRTEILELISEEDLAEAAHERFKQKAGQGDGYAAAFLYALNGDAKHLETARQWLLDWPRKAGYVRHYRKRLNTPNSI